MVLYPSIDSWFIGGHSLGGYSACQCADEYYEKLNGIILLGSYTGVDLSDTDLAVLSIYGENDRVLNYENYQKGLSLLPISTTEHVIEGGNHAYFGAYGEQSGDGEMTIKNEEQIEITCGLITDFLLENYEY